MKITFSDHVPEKVKSLAKLQSQAIIIGVNDDLKLSALGKEVDKISGGAVGKALKAGRFTGQKGQFISLFAPTGVDAEWLIIAGLGKEKDFDTLAQQSLGGKLLTYLNQAGIKTATLVVDAKKGGTIAADIAYGAALKDYRFDKYFTQTKPEDKSTLTALTFAVDDAKGATKQFKDYEKLVDAVFFVRDMVSEPANVIYPATLADRCKELKSLGVEVEVLGIEQMKKLGMNALLGVGQGSAKESKLVVMRWEGTTNNKTKAPLAFVGKGVTFDTGGISIKPAAGMEEMKWDMGGAATVIGTMYALASRKAKVNAVGVVGLVENMPDGNAQRPGDVVKSMSGQTIEVLNTDAEGRLVLSDALWYTQQRFKPRFIIDLATLTGAIIVALGTSRAGLFSNDDKLSQQLFDTGKAVGEEVWRLPLADVYDKQINSDIADMQNIGKDREAGSITAAQFLQRFVNKYPWAHLDIAGVAWGKGNDVTPKGAAGWGVRLLNQLVADHYEGK